MSKYIRTKDGRIFETTTHLNGFYFIKSKKNSSRIFEEKVIKSADTIEELCSEFVGVDSNFNHYKMEKIDGKFYTKCDDGTYRQVNFPIYGAIWTDEGLIYVAKMNRKGVLELL